MRLRDVLASLTFAACCPAQSTLDRDALIARMRENAASYTERLQDFLCMQDTVRSTASTGNPNRWNGSRPRY